MLDRRPDKRLSDLVASLPLTYAMPTLSPFCADDVKYDVVERVLSDLKALAAEGGRWAGAP